MKHIYGLIILLMTLKTNAQDSASIKENPKLKFIVYLAVNQVSTKNLNSKLNDLNYDEPTNFFGIGTGLKYGSKKLFGGANTSIYMPCIRENSKYNLIQLEGYLNHIILEKKKFSIVSGVDLGFQIVKAYFTYPNSATNFDSLFRSNANTIQILNSALTSGISATLHRKPFEKRFIFERLLFENIRIGYKFGLNNNAWKSETNSLANSPKDRLNSFYIQFSTEF